MGSVGLRLSDRRLGDSLFADLRQITFPLRDAVGAFGSPGGEVPLASPATGEAIFAAIQARRKG